MYIYIWSPNLEIRVYVHRVPQTVIQAFFNSRSGGLRHTAKYVYTYTLCRKLCIHVVLQLPIRRPQPSGKVCIYVYAYVYTYTLCRKQCDGASPGDLEITVVGVF